MCRNCLKDGVTCSDPGCFYSGLWTFIEIPIFFRDTDHDSRSPIAYSFQNPIKTQSLIIIHKIKRNYVGCNKLFKEQLF